MNERERAEIRAAPPSAAIARQLMRQAAETDLAQIRAQGAEIRDVPDDERRRWAIMVSNTHAELVATIGGESRKLYSLIENGKRAFARR